MEISVSDNMLFKKWIDFCSGKSVLECEFFPPKSEPVDELLGSFASQRLTAFGEHASGSLIGFYAEKEAGHADSAPVAWLDSEGSPCIVVAENIRKFLAVFPYGSGYIYSVASVIENNPDDDNIMAKAEQRLGTGYQAELDKAAARFPDHEQLIAWLSENGIEVSIDPVSDIVAAHQQFPGLTDWLISNI